MARRDDAPCHASLTRGDHSSQGNTTFSHFWRLLEISKPGIPLALYPGASSQNLNFPFALPSFPPASQRGFFLPVVLYDPKRQNGTQPLPD
jgi:hypothetical protein